MPKVPSLPKHPVMDRITAKRTAPAAAFFNRATDNAGCLICKTDLPQAASIHIINKTTGKPVTLPRWYNYLV